MSISKWIACYYNPEDIVGRNVLEYKCANCFNYNPRDAKYCPSCGAKMVGVDRNYVRITHLFPMRTFSLAEAEETLKDPELEVEFCELTAYLTENGYRACMEEITKQMEAEHGRKERAV